MRLEEKSKQLKNLVSNYETKWFLGDLSWLIQSGRERAPDQLGNLSSPLRQLYYLAGLNISTKKEKGTDYTYNPEKWEEIVRLLTEIEIEYEKLLFHFEDDEDLDKWKKIREVAVPSFLSYFNQGHLNYEEQVINWIINLYTPFNKYFIETFNLTIDDFITFYNNLDKLVQNNFQGFTTNNKLLRDNWEEYTSINSGIDSSVPTFFKESIPENFEIISKFMLDKGMSNRFYPRELISDNLSLNKINTILSLISTTRKERDFLYYTETNPGNPLYQYPIINLENEMFQVFEMKQVIHAISELLEKKVIERSNLKEKYIKNKGELLEKNIIKLFKKFFGEEIKIFTSYYVNGKEQDILILWKDYAFIIEAKNYKLNEPFRDPEKAFLRIKRDFKKSIQNAYNQTSRIEQIIINQEPLIIRNKNNEIIETIDTKKIKQDFSIIVNLNSFGLIQNDLSYLLELNNEDDVYPWVVSYDDLEIFILTLIAKNKSPKYLIDFLLFREELHGKLICSDELEICGGYLSKQFNIKKIKYQEKVITHPSFGNIFDEQYFKGMGFENEKYLDEKRSGKYIFI